MKRLIQSGWLNFKRDYMKYTILQTSRPYCVRLNICYNSMNCLDLSLLSKVQSSEQGRSQAKSQKESTCPLFPLFSFLFLPSSPSKKQVHSLFFVFFFRFQNDMADLQFVEKVARWLSNCQVKVKTEVANSNAQSCKIYQSLDVLERLIIGCETPSLDTGVSVCTFSS